MLNVKIFRKILYVPHNTIMDMNNAMFLLPMQTMLTYSLARTQIVVLFVMASATFWALLPNTQGFCLTFVDVKSFERGELMASYSCHEK